MAVRLKPIPAGETVTVRITKHGAGLVSTGEHLATRGDATHEAGDLVPLPRETAAALEARGFAEIQ